MKVDHRYLVFSLYKEQYAIPLLEVKEVIGPTEITPVPQTPSYFKGIMNLRGQVISIIDLRMKFKMPTSEQNGQTAIVILDLAPLSLGVIVNSVDTVLALTEEEINTAPDVENKMDVSYLSGVAKKDKKLILLLNIVNALSVEDMTSIKNQIKEKAA